MSKPTPAIDGEAEHLILRLLEEHKVSRPKGLGYMEIIQMATERERAITHEDAWSAIVRLSEKKAVAVTPISIQLS